MAGDWSDEQNDAIVADCFAMLGDDIAGIEYKHQNISAVLKGLAEDWVPGDQ